MCEIKMPGMCKYTQECLNLLPLICFLSFLADGCIGGVEIINCTVLLPSDYDGLPIELDGLLLCWLFADIQQIGIPIAPESL